MSAMDGWDWKDELNITKLQDDFKKLRVAQNNSNLLVANLKFLLLKLCREIESLPASEQQTSISLMASDIYHLIANYRGAQNE